MEGPYMGQGIGWLVSLTVGGNIVYLVSKFLLKFWNNFRRENVLAIKPIFEFKNHKTDT
jgi:hypothetical protein